jgi:signal transduction histidine kinase
VTSVRQLHGTSTILAIGILVVASAAAAMLQPGVDHRWVVASSALLLASLFGGGLLIERRVWGRAVVFPVQLVAVALVLVPGPAICLLSPLAVVGLAVLYLRPRTAALVTGAVVAMSLYALAASDKNAAVSMLHYLTAGVCVIAFSGIAVRQHDERERTAQLAREVEELASTRERNRIARDVHDGLGHALTVAHVQLEAARDLIPRDPERAAQIVARAQSVLQDGLRDVRCSVGLLREPSRPHALGEALRRWASALHDEGIAVELALPDARWVASPAATHVLYRVAQEALTNLRKHAAARSVAIVVERNATTLRMTIRDDGRGATEMPAPGFGLVGLRERVAALGGTIDVATSPGRGFALTLELPEAA